MQQQMFRQLYGINTGMEGLTIGYAQQDVEVTTNTKGDEHDVCYICNWWFTVGIKCLKILETIQTMNQLVCILPVNDDLGFLR